jgi:hypothetical protein
MDFGGVRVHNDPHAAASAHARGATAFTRGRDTMLGSGAPPTESPGGQHLIAHELTHVAQQNAGLLRGERREPGRDTEREADSVAHQLTEDIVGLRFR